MNIGHVPPFARLSSQIWIEFRRIRFEALGRGPQSFLHGTRANGVGKLTEKLKLRREAVSTGRLEKEGRYEADGLQTLVHIG